MKTHTAHITGLIATLKAERVARGWSLAVIEYRTGVTKSSVAAYERGDRVPPADTLQAWAGGFGWRLTLMFDVEDARD